MSELSKKGLTQCSVTAFAILLVLLPIFSEQKSLSSFALYIQEKPYFAIDNSTSSRNSTLESGATYRVSNISTPTRIGADPSIGDKMAVSKQEIDEYFRRSDISGNESQWIVEYLKWHSEARVNFFDTELIEKANGPNLLIVYLDPMKQKGGLTDRMKSLGHLLRMAHEEKRVILLKWYQAPLELESFLMPNLLNFTLPINVNTSNPTQLRDSYEGQTGRIKLQKFINQAGNYLHPYGLIWKAMFRPAPEVQQSIDEAFSELSLVEGQYDAVHCRLGHPAFSNKISYNGKVDTGRGYNFKGINRVHAIQSAIRGIRCAKDLADGLTKEGDIGSQVPGLPIYFYADSADLVKTVVEPSSMTPGDSRQNETLSELIEVVSTTRMVARTDAAIAHLENRNNETATDAYASTFVDLYIASKARCVSMGVGRFAYMAAKISGTNCWVRHQVPSSSVGSKWGMTLMSREVPECKLRK